MRQPRERRDDQPAFVLHTYPYRETSVIVETVTDNRNRTVSEIRHVFSKNGGNMGEAGSVAWMFQKKGYIIVENTKADEDTLMSLALDAGADDFEADGSNYEIYTAPNAFEGVIKPMSTVDDFAQALATHPQFAQAWAQKLCYYVNSATCDPQDPELILTAWGVGYKFADVD